MGNISTYSELKDAVANHLDRDTLTNRIPEFIAIGEARVMRKLRIRQMLKRATTTINEEYHDLPTDFIESRDIQLNTDPVRFLKYVTPHEMNKFYSFKSTILDTPEVYTILGEEYQFSPVPDQGYEAEIAYFARFAKLSGDNDSNWLLVNAPDIYLYASLVPAEPFLDNDKKIQTWGSLVESGIQDLNDQDVIARHSGAPLQRKGQTSENIGGTHELYRY